MNEHVSFMDWFLKQATAQGLAFLFLACVLAIFLYVAVMIVRVFNLWLPKWFESSMRTHATMRGGVREIIAIARQIKRDTIATRIGLGNALRGLEVLSKKPTAKERHGISSDVVTWLENARREIERDDDNGEPERHEDDPLADTVQVQQDDN